MSAVLDDAERSALLESLAAARTGFGLDAAGTGVHRRSPTCGDSVTVRVDVVAGRIESLRWEGHGCVVSTAAAGALAAAAAGLTVAQFHELALRYRASVLPDAAPLAVGDLDAFAGIGRFPLRAGCATLAWDAALEALPD